MCYSLSVDEIATQYMRFQRDTTLKVENTSVLEVGKDHSDFAVSFAYMSTAYIASYTALMHKGNTPSERTFGFWRHKNNKGLHCRISTSHSYNEGLNSDPIPLNKWVYITV